jgi:hypothetical protein
MSAYVSILQSAYGRVERGIKRGGFEKGGRVQDPCKCQHTSAYVSIRQHTEEMKREDLREEEDAFKIPANVSIRQHTSAYVSIRRRRKGRT